MAVLKTKRNKGDVEAFLNSVANEGKRQDSFTILDLRKKVMGMEPEMCLKNWPNDPWNTWKKPVATEHLPPLNLACQAVLVFGSKHRLDAPINPGF